MKIQNSIALVTGSNRGIGKSIVEALIAAGASKVYATARNAAAVQPLVDQFGDKIVPLELDLTQPESITAAAQEAADAEIVINNAGILNVHGPLDAQAITAMTEEFDINVFGLMRVAQAFAPVLKANGGGALVQLNSVVSIKTFADFSTYCGSKAAAYAITQGLRDTLADQNTLVVSVHPGPIATDMATAAGMADMAEPPSVVADAIIQGLENETFHVFPDSMAKQFGDAYASYAQAMIEAQPAEA